MRSSYLLPILPLPTLPTPPKNGCRIFRLPSLPLPSFPLPTLPLPSLPRIDDDDDDDDGDDDDDDDDDDSWAVFMVLLSLSWQSHCKRSSGSFDECGIAASCCRSLDEAT